MILFYLSFLALAAAVFLLAGSLRTPVRVAVALCVFAVPAILLTAWIFVIGDKPLPGARTVSPESVNESANESKQLPSD
jgi:hypothetical protein